MQKVTIKTRLLFSIIFMALSVSIVDANECNFNDLIVKVTSCEDGKFMVSIDFNYTEEHSDLFEVRGNGQSYGSHSYLSLPVALGPFEADGLTPYEFVIIDSLNDDCRAAVELGKVSCECQIRDVVIEAGDCTSDSTYIVELNFKTESFTSFSVYNNDHLVESSATSDLPLRLEHFPRGQKEKDFITIVSKDSGCEFTEDIRPPTCLADNCELRDLDVVETACIEGLRYVWIDLIHDGELSDYFVVSGNGMSYGKYAYVDLPVKVGPLADSEGKDYELVARDYRNEKCSTDLAFDFFDCEAIDCRFKEVQTEVTPCDDSLGFFVILDFEVKGMHSESFFVEIGEEKHDFLYESLPVKVGPLQGGETFYQMFIRDLEDPECSKKVKIGRVICDQQCHIDDFSASIVDCKEQLYIVQLSEVVSAFNAFDVSINGEYFGFRKAEEFPLSLEVPKKLVLDSTIRVSLCVSDNETCCKVIELKATDCKSNGGCEYLEIEGDTLECSRDSFWVKLHVSYQGAGETFSVRGNGVNYGSYRFDQVPISIGPLIADGITHYEFIAVDETYERCAGVLDLGPISCPNQQPPPGKRQLIVESGQQRLFFNVPDFMNERSILEIFDLQGRYIYDVVFSSESSRMVMSVPTLSSGMYILRLHNQTGDSNVLKFVVP